MSVVSLPQNRTFCLARETRESMHVHDFDSVRTCDLCVRNAFICVIYSVQCDVA